MIEEKNIIQSYYLLGKNKLEFSKKKYQIIYADPPWRYDFSNTKNRKIENHYNTMSIDDIKTLQVPADKNCILYLWATAPKLLEALDVMLSWGFKYKTQSIWDKEIIGMGYWWRGQHEILLVGVKGKMSPPPQSYRESSVYREKRTKHSKKPEYYKNFISKVYPQFNKIELFAREKTKGWDAWGNEIVE